MIKNIREIERPDMRLSAELISLICKSLNESSCSLRLICFEDQIVETLNDMRETIISCREPLTSKLTILSPGQGNQAEVGTETTTVQNVFDKSSKQEINTTTTMEEVEGDNPNIVWFLTFP